MVIINGDTYNEKVYEFIKSNNIKKLDKTPLNMSVKNLNKTINKCSNLINENTRHLLKPITLQPLISQAYQKYTKKAWPTHLVVHYTQIPQPM